MSKARTPRPRLRLFCICGQKMKVSPSMYGRPGKCVACRQKIRIPSADEIPPDAREIHLKDHPEFLRKVSSLPAEETPEAAAEEAAVIKLGEEDAPKEAASPLEVLEPLRTLCSLETKLDRHLKAFKEFERPSGKDKQEAELLGQRARVRRVRAELDEVLRQRLMEAAVDLATVQERLADLSLAVRVGEMDFRSYREQAEKLRRRRDRLEQRQQNLRGWLAVRDVHGAGGFVDLPLDNIPQRADVKLPREPEFAGSLVEQHVQALREALERREAAERKLRAAERVHPRDGEPKSRVRDLLAECKASERRAKAAVAFYMSRLRQLRDDYAGDLQAIESQLELARGRLQVGEIDRGQYNSLEDGLVRAKTDLAKASDMVGRALNAPSSADVPQPRGTFLGRLAPYRSYLQTSTDSYVAWGVAVLLVASLMLPVGGGYSPAGMYRNWGANGAAPLLVVLVPLLAALALIPAALVPRRVARGLAYLGVWVAGCAFFSAFLYGVLYAEGFLANLAEGTAAWYAQPGVVFWLVAASALLGAAGSVLAPLPRWRHLPWAVALIVIGSAAAVFTLSGEAVPPPSGPEASVPTPSAVATPPPVREPAVESPTTPPPAPMETEPAAPPEGETPAQPSEAPAAGEQAQTPPQETRTVQRVEVEWRGLVGAPGRSSVFSIVLYVPGMPPEDRMLEVGNIVYNDWKLAEYNPVTQTVMLANEKDVLVLRSGDRVTLETLR